MAKKTNTQRIEEHEVKVNNGSFKYVNSDIQQIIISGENGIVNYLSIENCQNLASIHIQNNAKVRCFDISNCNNIDANLYIFIKNSDIEDLQINKSSFGITINES